MSEAAVRGLQIIEYLASEDAPRGARDIGEALGMPRATVYRTIDELVADGWLREQGAPRRFSISLRVLQLGLVSLRQNRIRQVVLPSAIDLARATGLPCAMSFYEDGHVLHTDWVEVLADRVVPSPRGERAQAVSSASGKILLAMQAPEEVARVLKRGAVALTAATKTDPGAIAADLALTKARGYGISEGESSDGAGGLSVAVLDASGNAACALGILAPSLPLTEAFIEKVLPYARAFAGRASAELGHRTLWEGSAL